VFFVGIVNYAYMSFCVIVVGTFKGRGGNFKVYQRPIGFSLARWYVEIVVTLPLLIQIIFCLRFGFFYLPAHAKLPFGANGSFLISGPLCIFHWKWPFHWD